MNTANFITDLKDKGIKLKLTDSHLNALASKGVIVPEIVAKLSAMQPELIDFIRRPNSYVAIEKIQPVAHSDHYPISRSQRRLLILNESFPESRAYTISFSQILHKTVDPVIFSKAYDALIERHE